MNVFPLVRRVLVPLYCLEFYAMVIDQLVITYPLTNLLNVWFLDKHLFKSKQMNVRTTVPSDGS